MDHTSIDSAIDLLRNFFSYVTVEILERKNQEKTPIDHTGTAKVMFEFPLFVADGILTRFKQWNLYQIKTKTSKNTCTYHQTF